MPKLTEQELNNLKYVSMADYFQRVQNYENMNDKLLFTTRYLLLHGTGSGEPDYSLEEATYIAQLALSDASVQAKKRSTGNKEFLKKNPQIVNPHIKDAKEDYPFELFMNDPYTYLYGYAKKDFNRIENSDTELPRDIVLKNNCNELMTDKLDQLNFTDDVYELVTKNNPVGTMVRAQVKLGGKKQFDELMAASKPGFFSKMFGTTSLAGKNLDYVMKSYNNPDHALYGNKDALQKASVEYLKYKFPDWEPGYELPDIEANTKLDATSRARAKLSLAFIESLEDQYHSEEPLKDLVEATQNQQHKITFQEADRRLSGQRDFQNKIAFDLDDSFEDEVGFANDEPQPQAVKEKDDNELDTEELLKNIEVDK